MNTTEIDLPGTKGRPLTPAQQRLVADHFGLLVATARKLSARLPASVDDDDLVGAGAIGLIAAAASYNPGRGVTFATYAGRRVHGAMLDWLRDIDWVPRLERRRARLDGRVLTSMGSLSSHVAADGGTGTKELGDTLAATGIGEGGDRLDFDDLVGRLTSGFTLWERYAFRMYLIEERSLERLAQGVGISASRMSQIMSNLFARARAAYGRDASLRGSR